MLYVCAYNTHSNALFLRHLSWILQENTSRKRLYQIAKEGETEALVLRHKQATERVLGTDSCREGLVSYKCQEEILPRVKILMR